MSSKLKTHKEYKHNSIESYFWKRIYSFIRSYWIAILLAIVLLAGSAITQPGLALIMRPLLDEGFAGENTFYVWIIPLSVIGLIFFRGICNFCSDYLLAWIANNILLRIRKDMFDSLLTLSDSNFKIANTRRLLNKFIVDASNITGLATEVVTVIIRESLIILALLGVLFYISWKLTLIAVSVLPISIFVTQIFIKRLRWINRNTINMNAELTRIICECIDGQRIIKLFNGYQTEKKRFDFVSIRLRRFAMRASISDAALAPITQFCIACLVALVIAVALTQATHESLTVGGFASFVTALAQIPDPVKRLNNIFGKAQKMLVAAENVFSLLDEKKERNNGTQILRSPVRGKIQFKNLQFCFPNSNHYALQDISFTIHPGQTVALVGRSGSGKTTLINMLPRFISATSGEILLDDVPIQKLDLINLRSHLSIVDQNSIFFNDTIAANIAYGMEHQPNKKQIKSALEAASLIKFVNGLSKGIETKIGENATLLSVGERQRLAIARALIKNAPILILDEATSSLDNESECAIQDSLEQFSREKTTIIIAHRLSTIQNVDRIFVMDNGKILESGTHSELLKFNGTYALLYRMKFRKII
ncbi:MAG: lipid A export permease/ATP-binding protein MsbA [Bordetella sp.]|nr:MAG: lipid A export permease/ATP-binding protein MsbA [Bordetella sp.]